MVNFSDQPAQPQNQDESAGNSFLLCIGKDFFQGKERERDGGYVINCPNLEALAFTIGTKTVAGVLLLQQLKKTQKILWKIGDRPLRRRNSFGRRCLSACLPGPLMMARCLHFIFASEDDKSISLLRGVRYL